MVQFQLWTPIYPIDSSDEELRVFREPVDDVFAYILQTIDNAIIDLPKRVLTTNDLGRMDQGHCPCFKI